LLADLPISLSSVGYVSVKLSIVGSRVSGSGFSDCLC
jgi:hypothetical protein